ncbi:hypothetical protein SDC9_142001 [bioreactor metagenome]|uniref:Uncharacterized protein n=1 Tax=bioreactor metagenome TaxID=1076179 RepID=A0A645E2Q0_9ZZZZ
MLAGEISVTLLITSAVQSLLLKLLEKEQVNRTIFPSLRIKEPSRDPDTFIAMAAFVFISTESSHALERYEIPFGKIFTSST